MPASWRLTLLTASLLLTPLAAAQSIEVGELGTAEAYDVGTLEVNQGGLDRNLWQTTSASRAIKLLEKAPTDSSDPIVRSLIRAAVLSGGVPPQAGDAGINTAFKKARINTIIAMGEMGAAQDIISRTSLLTRDNQLQADMHLRAGNDVAACAVTDTVLEGRAAPNWARLRAYCHVVRGEIAAAELTTDVLRGQDYKDPTYFNLMNRLGGGVGKPDFSSLSSSDPLHIALMARADLEWPKTRPKTAAARMALSPAVSAEKRLVALYAANEALSDAQMRQVLQSLKTDDADLAGDTLAGGAAQTFEAAMAADVPKGTALLFEIAQSGTAEDRPKAMAEFLKRAKGAGVFDRFAALSAPVLQGISAQAQAATDVKLFVSAAISQQDTQSLRRIYAALGNKPETQERIALISDALGYGFLGGELGIDLETRLSGSGDVKLRAERDIFIALAMGARLSDIAEAQLLSIGPGEGRAISAGELAVLQAAAGISAQAETALRSAAILSKGTLDNPSLYAVIRALSEAGLTSFAGRVAAQDFVQDLPG